MLMPVDIAALAVALVAFFIGVTFLFRLNVADHKARAAMTPAQRAAEDAETHIPGDWGGGPR